MIYYNEITYSSPLFDLHIIQICDETLVQMHFPKYICERYVGITR